MPGNTVGLFRAVDSMPSDVLPHSYLAGGFGTGAIEGPFVAECGGAVDKGQKGAAVRSWAPGIGAAVSSRG